MLNLPCISNELKKNLTFVQLFMGAVIYGEGSIMTYNHSIQNLIVVFVHEREVTKFKLKPSIKCAALPVKSPRFLETKLRDG